jgi:hypothetical protein
VSTDFDVRQKIARDIQILKASCESNKLSKSFIAGLDTATEIVTGEIRIDPAAYNHPTDVPLFDISDEASLA